MLANKYRRKFYCLHKVDQPKLTATSINLNGNGKKDLVRATRSAAMLIGKTQ